MNFIKLTITAGILMIFIIGCNKSSTDLESLNAKTEGKYMVHIFGETISKDLGNQFTKFWNTDKNARDYIEGVQLYDSQPKDVELRKKLKIKDFSTLVICDNKGIVKMTQDPEEVYSFFRSLPQK